MVGGGRGGGIVTGAEVDDFVGGVYCDARVEEAVRLEGCEDEVLWVVDEVAVGHFGCGFCGCPA